jgi:hypothetical protein
VSANIYTHPEAYGLTVVADVEAASGYEFDTFVIWRDKTGAFWWAQDQGCSCPVPFDGKDLSNLPSGSLKDAITDLKAWMAESPGSNRTYEGRLALDKLIHETSIRLVEEGRP